MPTDNRLRSSADAGPPPTWTSVLVALAVAVLVAGGGLVRGQEKEKDRGKAVKPQVKAARDLTDAEAEAAALAFVRENHPELASLLAQLKPMKPDEYRRAVRELAQVSRSLAEIKTSNPKRYAMGLEVWKARSRVDLLAARLASATGPASPDLEGQLHQAVEALVDAEIRQQTLEKEIVQERLRKVSENLERLESRRGSAVESRFQALLKKSQRARRKAGASAAEAVGQRGDRSVAKTTNASANEGEGNPRKGERQP